MQSEKLKKVIQSITIRETQTKSTFCMVDFTDDSHYSFFKSTDVDILRNCNNGTTICFIGFKKGDWNNGKEVELYIEPGVVNQDKSFNGISNNEVVLDLMVEIKKLLIELVRELKARRL